MFQCNCIVAEGVFETMKASRRTLGSPSRRSISLIVLKKLNLGVCRPEVPNTLWVHEDYVLLTVGKQPHDEVGVEVAGFEEAHAAALAEVS